MTRKPALSLLLLAALLAGGCSSGEVTTALHVAITAAEVAIPVVGQQTGVDAASLKVASAYLRAANDALTLVTTELGSGDPPAVMAAKVTAALADVAQVNLPAETPLVVVRAIKAVASAIRSLMAHFPSNTAARVMPPVNLTVGDRAELARAQARLEMQRLALAGLPK